jgi:hypothetical protein
MTQIMWQKKMTIFFNLQVSKLAWQTLWEVMSFQGKGQGLYSQQDSFFATPLAATLYFLTQGLLIWGIAFC